MAAKKEKYKIVEAFPGYLIKNAGIMKDAGIAIAGRSPADLKGNANAMAPKPRNTSMNDCILWARVRMSDVDIRKLTVDIIMIITNNPAVDNLAISVMDIAVKDMFIGDIIHSSFQMLV